MTRRHAAALVVLALLAAYAAAPWTAFQGKYWLWNWPWRETARLWRRLAKVRFDVGLSARWDPRDHFVLRGVHAVLYINDAASARSAAYGAGLLVNIAIFVLLAFN